MSADSVYSFDSADQRREEAETCLQLVIKVMEEDSVTKYYAKGHRRREFSSGLYTSGFKALQCRSTLFTLSGNRACAFVLRHPAQQMNVPAKLWHGGWKPLLTCVPLTYWYSLLALGDKFEKRHKQFTQENGPHLYLWIIVTDFEAQGQGLGGRLLAALTAMADQEGLWCYVESTTHRSRDLYALHGFQKLDEWEVDPEALTIYPMARKPKELQGT